MTNFQTEFHVSWRTKSVLGAYTSPVTNGVSGGYTARSRLAGRRCNHQIAVCNRRSGYNSTREKTGENYTVITVITDLGDFSRKRTCMVFLGLLPDLVITRLQHTKKGALKRGRKGR